MTTRIAVLTLMLLATVPATGAAGQALPAAAGGDRNAQGTQARLRAVFHHYPPPFGPVLHAAPALLPRPGSRAPATRPAAPRALFSHAAVRPGRTSSLRTGPTIGAPQEVIAAAQGLGAAEICNVYGQTESYGNCCVAWHHWPLERRAHCQGFPRQWPFRPVPATCRRRWMS